MGPRKPVNVTRIQSKRQTTDWDLEEFTPHSGDKINRTTTISSDTHMDNHGHQAHMVIQRTTTKDHSLKKFCTIKEEQSTQAITITPDMMIQVITLRKIDNNIDIDKAQDRIRTTRHNRHTDHSQVGNQLGVLPHGTHTSEYT